MQYFECLLRMILNPPPALALNAPPNVVLEKRLALPFPPFIGLRISPSDPTLCGTKKARQINELNAKIEHEESIFTVEAMYITDKSNTIVLETSVPTYSLEGFQASPEYYALRYQFSTATFEDAPLGQANTFSGFLRIDIIGPDQELIAAGETYASVDKQVTLPLCPMPGMKICLSRLPGSQLLAEENAQNFNFRFDTITVNKININESWDEAGQFSEYVLRGAVSTPSLTHFRTALQIFQVCYGFEIF